MWYNKLVAAGYAVVAEGAFTDGLQYRIDFAGCMVGRVYAEIDGVRVALAKAPRSHKISILRLIAKDILAFIS